MKSHVKFNAIRLACAAALGVSTMFAGVSHAANTVSFDATATVIAPISIAKTTDLVFGRFSHGGGGSVIMTAAGVRSQGGGVILAPGGTPGAASFAVTGEANATYAVTMPTETTITGPAAATMTVGTWTAAYAAGADGTLSAGGAQTLQVGATLTVANNQAAGAYTGAFTMQVDYN